MLYFENDYSEGAHSEVLNALIKTNDNKLTGYGSDEYSSSAKEKIKKACHTNGDVYLLTGGTQTNQIIIDSLLESYQGVVSAVSGHVNAHEAGAIEYTGHKVIALNEHEGKVDSQELLHYLETFYADENHDHMVFPGMVYISHPTEYGTLYTKKELENLSKVCHQYNIPLYLDGARLGYGIMAKGSDVDLTVIAQNCDVFYIGGTKVGALCGEAVVFTNKAPKHFVSIVKQHGALLAKGRLLGVQFDALFSNELYFKISQNAIDMAELLKEGLVKKGYDFYINSPTNQQFIIIENNKMEELRKEVRFSFWEKYDDAHTVIRLATSWATTKEDIENLMKYL